MINRDALAEYLDQYLAAQKISDYAPNGLQIEGRSEIRKLCTAVSITQTVIRAAIEWQADAILVHHGFFWRGERSVLTGIRRQRIADLLSHNLNVFAYHLPLDLHPIVGNNACLAQRLPVTNVTQHDVEKLPKGLWVGELAEGIVPRSMASLLEDALLQAPIHIAVTRPKIQRIAWCTGAAQDFLEETQRLNVDAYISGEISERTYDLAQELDIHYFACGHHATERYGVQALATHLVQEFGIEHRFIETNNPI